NHFAHADVAQDLSADSVVAEIRFGRAQMSARAEVPVAACGDSGAAVVDVARDRVGFALEIEDNPLAERGDTLHRGLQEAAGVARRITKDVAGKVFSMRPHA